MARDRLVLLTWTVLLAATIIVLARMAGGALATPALTDAGAWADWLAATPPATAVFALLRLLVVALAWYLLAATALGVGARLVRARHLTSIADALMLPSLRHLLQAAVGLGLAAGAVGIAPTAPSAAHAVQGSSGDADVGFRPPVLDTPLWDPVPESATVVLPLPPRGRSYATPPALDPEFVGTPSLEAAQQRSAPGTTAPQEPRAVEQLAASSAPPAPETWVVRAGEHFWSIAETRVATVSPEGPREPDVAEYWRRLIAANRAVLAVPGEPDLLFPHQVLSLPPLES